MRGIDDRVGSNIVDGHVDISNRRASRIVRPNRVLRSGEDNTRSSADVAVCCVEVEGRTRRRRYLPRGDGSTTRGWSNMWTDGDVLGSSNVVVGIGYAWCDIVDGDVHLT